MKSYQEIARNCLLTDRFGFVTYKLRRNGKCQSIGQHLVQQ